MLHISLVAALASFVFLTSSNTANALNNGVAKLPILGWNTWYAYQCDINEGILLQTAQLMKSLGLQAVGYNFVNIDDCWAEKNRTAAGDIIEDQVRFKSGMKSLNQQIHALGFLTGIYSDSGWFTCAGYPGSYSNELRDAQTFYDMGFDLLKYDNCAIPFDNITREGEVGRYQRMSDALAQVAQSAGRNFVFSLCEWGWTQVWTWGAELGHMWRTTNDAGVDSMQWESLTSIINFNSFLTQATNFYGHNDMDILQIGDGGLTFEEAKSHFTVWALMKAPLLIGTNLSAISPELLGILKNTEILAINQDPVIGTSVSPFRWGINPDWTSNNTHPAQYWSGQTQSGTVFMLLNTLDVPSSMSFNLTESPWIRAGRQYSVRDLWTHTDNGTAVRNFTAKHVPPHGVVALLLKDAGDEPAGLYPPCSVWVECTSQNGTLVGGS